MKKEKRQEGSLPQGTNKKKKHRHRQSETNSERHSATKTISSSASTSDDEEHLFQIEKSYTVARPTPASQQSILHVDSIVPNLTTDIPGKPAQLTDISRLQEFDIQRTLLPVSHASVPLSTVNASNANDPSVPSSNLRSYIALPRTGANGTNRIVKSIDETNPISRTELSVLSGKNTFNDCISIDRSD